MRAYRAVTLLTACLPMLALACNSPKDEEETQASTTESGSSDTQTSESDTQTSESDTQTAESDSAETETGETETGETETGETETGETETGETETGETEMGETETGETETGETETGETETGETGGVISDCGENDEFEDNDLAETASLFEWNNNGPVGGISRNLVAFLCVEEDDWYRFNVSEVEFEFDDGEYYGLHLDAIVEGSSWCGEGCENPFLPPAPESTITIEVLDAETLELLDSSVNDQGRININGSGEAYSHDLLVHVYGPTPAATFSYNLYFEIRAYNGEDECEC